MECQPCWTICSMSIVYPGVSATPIWVQAQFPSRCGGEAQTIPPPTASGSAGSSGSKAGVSRAVDTGSYTVSLAQSSRHCYRAVREFLQQCLTPISMQYVRNRSLCILYTYTCSIGQILCLACRSIYIYNIISIPMDKSSRSSSKPLVLHMELYQSGTITNQEQSGV